MLVSFSFDNILSFKDKQVLDLTADPLKGHSNHLHIPQGASAHPRLIKTLGIYGHNSYGKSNLIKAYQFFLNLIFTSFSLGGDEHIVEPDRFLSENCNDEPSSFEVVFILLETKYRYGFEIGQKRVMREWLFYAELGVRENYLFDRKGQDITTSRQWNKMSGNKVDHTVLFTKSSHLLLSALLSQHDIPRIDAIEKWFKGNIILADVSEDQLVNKAISIFSDNEYNDLVLQFIKDADLGFYEIIQVLKCGSSGSLKYFILSCYLAYAIRHGQLVLVDELDAKLHVLLLQHLMKTYNDPAINNAGSQLIFTTHNTALLSNKLFRRDQFAVIEKNEYGESSIRKMHTSKRPLRADISLEKEYIKGALGGVSPKLTANTDGHHHRYGRS